MPYCRCIGELAVVCKIWPEELSVEWRIQDVLSLPSGSDDWYTSPDFRFGNERWRLSIWPNWKRRIWNPASGWVGLALVRYDGGPPITLHFSVGIQGSGGLQKSTEREKEFLGYCSWNMEDFCSRSELMEHKDGLMPDGVLTIVSVLKKPAAARGDSLAIYSYEELQTAVQRFCSWPLQASRCKIGEGGFGTVYRAVIRGDIVAIKRLNDPMDSEFITELKTLTNYKHENLLPILGYCLGPPNCCLLYEYMPNGSLEDRLACNNQSKPLRWQTRLSIAYGSAAGINHLHTYQVNKPLIHRDIKSANILLNQRFVPKVGDFGMVRMGNSGGLTTLAVTKKFSETFSYMPREALVGDVSVKWDTFSFGVVLLELLTGLPPYDPDRENVLLITHMENCKDIISRLDPKAKWNKKAAKELYKITQRCLAESKRSRPTISEV